MSLHTKIGDVRLSPNKGLVQAKLKQDVLQIFIKNLLGTVNIDVEQKRRVLLQRGEDGFGMHIMGGQDRKKLVSIQKVVEGYPASSSGQVFDGDVILAINGEPVQDKNHEEVIDMLKNSGKYVTLHLAKIKAETLDDNDDEPVDKHDNIPEWIVNKEILLTTASITKYKEGTNELRQDAFEVVSMDGQDSVILYFGGTNESVQDWYDCIHYNISLLNQQEVANQNSKMIEGEKEIRHMGYVHELLEANRQSSSWERKFLVLREACLEIFTTVPRTVGEWMRPEKTYALTEISIELLPASQGERLERIKLIAGIGNFHIISFEHHNDIVSWTNNIHLMTSLLVKKIQIARFPAMWKEQEVDFVIDYNHGLLIQGQDKHTKWQKSFSQLRNTDDDGNRKLIMEFVNSSQEVVELEDLNIVVCTIQAFLAARVADIDMGLIVQTGLIVPA